MFTRAGFNLKGARRWDVWARVSVIEGRRAGWACILEFACGDLAWYSEEATFLIWGHRASIHKQAPIYLPGGWSCCERYPRSSLLTRKVMRWHYDHE